MSVASSAAGAVTDPDLDEYRHELTGFCYRMLGSIHDAEDAVQEAMVRAWRGLDRFDGRSSLRTWLYRIATNVCLDALAGRSRRALPIDLSEPSPPVASALGEPRPAGTWLEPAPDERTGLTALTGDPADIALARDSVRLAFVAALQHLPPRQRVVLLLRDVLRWRAAEVAGLLDSTVASVNSALQRARATLADRRPAAEPPLDPLDDAQRALLARYLDAFERYDMATLVELLHQDAVQSMPPFAEWLHGRDDIVAWMLGPGAGCRGSRVLVTSANGCPALAQYRPSGPGGRHEPWGLHVVEVSGGRVARLTVFLEHVGSPAAGLFPLFGLPAQLEVG